MILPRQLCNSTLCKGQHRPYCPCASLATFPLSGNQVAIEAHTHLLFHTHTHTHTHTILHGLHSFFNPKLLTSALIHTLFLKLQFLARPSNLFQSCFIAGFFSTKLRLLLLNQPSTRNTTVHSLWLGLSNKSTDSVFTQAH